MAKKTSKIQAPTIEQVATELPPAVETTTAPTTTTIEPVQLTIADLQLLSRIVDLASRRGAFQAAELSQVGDAFNKLSGFLAYIESTQKTEQEESAAV